MKLTERLMLPLLACVFLLLVPPVIGVGRSASDGDHLSGLEAFPPSDIRVMSDHSTSNVLHVRFENLSRPLTKVLSAETCSYLVAGAPDRVPTVTVTSARFYKVKSDGVVAMSDGLPPATGTAQNAVRIVQLGQIRQYAVYNLSVPKVLATSDSADAPAAWVTDFLDLDIDVGPPPALSPEQSARAAGFAPPTVEPSGLRDEPDARRIETIASSQLLNPDICPLYYRLAKDRGWQPAQEWARRVNAVLDAGGAALRFTLYRPGVFQLSRQAVSSAAAGRSVGPTAEWRLFRGGQELPMLADGIDGVDGVVMAVQPFDADVAGGEVYWLFTRSAGTETTPPLRMEVVPPPTEGRESGAAGSTVARFELSASECTDYNARVNPTGDTTRWFWRSVSPDKIASLPVELPQHFSPQTTGGVEITVYYSLVQAVSLLPAMELIINGTSVGQTSCTAAQGKAVVQVPAASLRPGLNQLGVGLEYPGNPSQRPDLLVHRVGVVWTEALRSAADTRTPFTVTGALSTTPAVRFERVGASTTAPLLFSVGGQSAPYALRGARAGEGLIYHDLRGGATYTVQVPAAAPVVQEYVAVNRLELFDTQRRADYVAVAPQEYRAALEPLMALRRQQGFRVAEIDPQTAFDHFGYGVRSADAIKNFLSYAFNEWPAPKVEYVLLAGEASDYRGDPSRLPNGAIADQVPVCADDRPAVVRGDHGYSTICGTDQLADLAVGRLSVRTPQEMAAVVRKIIAYEEQKPAAWTLRDMFVVDDNEEFPRMALEAMGIGVAPYADTIAFQESEFPYVPNTRVQGRRRSHKATAQLMQRFEDGSALVNFFGHGGPNLWTHERLLHISDVPRLKNELRLPLVVCSSCDNAWLDYPVPPVSVSMGELFVKQEHGGAIGLFGPVAGASPQEHVRQSARLCDAIYRRDVRRLGIATAYAKNRYVGDTNSATLPEQYVLVGDPAVCLTIPSPDGHIRVDPAVVPAGSPQSVRLSLRLRGGEDVRVASVCVRAAGRWNGQVLRRYVDLVPGVTRLDLPLPALEPGPYAVTVETEERGRTGCYVARLDVDPLVVGLEDRWLTSPRVVAPDENVDMSVRVFNPTRLDIPSLQLRTMAFRGSKPSAAVGDGRGPRRLIDAVMALAPGAGRSFGFVWIPDIGRRLLATVSGPGVTSIRRETTMVVGDRKTSYSAQIPEGRLRVTPASPTEGDSVSVQAEVWNTGLAPLVGAEVRLVMDEATSGAKTPIGNVQPGAIHTVSVPIAKSLPAGETSVTLQVHARDDSASPPLLRLLCSTDGRVRVASGPDISFVPGSARVDGTSDSLRARTTVFVHATLQNTGDSAARGIMLELLLNDPRTGNEAVTLNDLTSVNVDELKPGAQRDVLFRWEDNLKPGEQRLWLVANRRHTIREQDYGNNTIAVPPFILKPLGNFAVADFAASHTVVLAGQRVGVSLTARNEADYARGPIDAEIGLKNRLTDETSAVRLLIPKLEPGGEARVSTELTATPGFQEIFGTVNASRDVEEVNTGDNTTDTLFQVIRSLDDLTTETGGAVSYRSAFSDCDTTNLELLPGGELRMQRALTVSAGLVPVAPDQLVTATLPADTQEADADKPTSWTLHPWRLEAPSSAKPAEIRLSVPVGADLGDTLCDVKVLMLGGANYKGSRVGPFNIRFADDGKLVPVTPTQSPGTPVEQSIAVGRHRLQAGRLNLAIRQISGSAAVIIAFEAYPVICEALAPPVLLPESAMPRSLLLRLDADTSPSTGIRFGARYGKMRPDGGVDWTPWTDVRAAEVRSRCAGRLVQWHVTLTPTGYERPTVRDVRLSFE